MMTSPREPPSLLQQVGCYYSKSHPTDTKVIFSLDVFLNNPGHGGAAVLGDSLLESLTKARHKALSEIRTNVKLPGLGWD